MSNKRDMTGLLSVKEMANDIGASVAGTNDSLKKFQEMGLAEVVVIDGERYCKMSKLGHALSEIQDVFEGMK